MRPLDPADGQPILVAVAAQAHSKGTTKPASSLLILSSKSGSMTTEAEAKLRKAFAGSLIVEFDPKMDLEKLVAPRALIVVAGGDGTIGWVVRRLVDTKHPLGILSLGTFNTTSIGSQMPVSDKTPQDPYLELSVHAGRSRTDIVKRVLARAVLSKHKEQGLGQVFRFRKLEVITKPKVRIYADNVHLGRTPATITAELSALQVILTR